MPYSVPIAKHVGNESKINFCKRSLIMKIVKAIILLALMFTPAMSMARDYNNYQEDPRWLPSDTRESYRSYEDYNYNDREGDYDDRDRYEKKHRRQKQAPAGWDIPPEIARQAPNCYRYTLSVDGNRGSARITSLPGTNYIQTSGQKSGYVCFDGSPTLELGKLADRGTRVTLRLEGRGKYTFNRNDPGSSFKNNWYRSYWGL
jgi:hypothetical protein